MTLDKNNSVSGVGVTSGDDEQNPKVIAAVVTASSTSTSGSTVSTCSSSTASHSLSLSVPRGIRQMSGDDSDADRAAPGSSAPMFQAAIGASSQASSPSQAVSATGRLGMQLSESNWAPNVELGPIESGAPDVEGKTCGSEGETRRSGYSGSTELPWIWPQCPPLVAGENDLNSAAPFSGTVKSRVLQSSSPSSTTTVAEATTTTTKAEMPARAPLPLTTPAAWLVSTSSSSSGLLPATYWNSTRKLPSPLQLPTPSDNSEIFQRHGLRYSNFVRGRSEKSYALLDLCAHNTTVLVQAISLGVNGGLAGKGAGIADFGLSRSRAENDDLAEGTAAALGCRNSCTLATPLCAAMLRQAVCAAAASAVEGGHTAATPAPLVVAVERESTDYSPGQRTRRLMAVYQGIPEDLETQPPSCATFLPFEMTNLQTAPRLLDGKADGPNRDAAAGSSAGCAVPFAAFHEPQCPNLLPRRLLGIMAGDVVALEDSAGSTATNNGTNQNANFALDNNPRRAFLTYQWPVPRIDFSMPQEVQEEMLDFSVRCNALAFVAEPPPGGSPNCEWHSVVMGGMPFMLLTSIPRVRLTSGEVLFAVRAVAPSQVPCSVGHFNTNQHAPITHLEPLSEKIRRAVRNDPVEVSRSDEAALQEKISTSTATESDFHGFLKGQVSENNHAPQQQPLTTPQRISASSVKAPPWWSSRTRELSVQAALELTSSWQGPLSALRECRRCREGRASQGSSQRSDSPGFSGCGSRRRSRVRAAAECRLLRCHLDPPPRSWLEWTDPGTRISGGKCRGEAAGATGSRLCEQHSSNEESSNQSTASDSELATQKKQSLGATNLSVLKALSRLTPEQAASQFAALQRVVIAQATRLATAHQTIMALSKTFTLYASQNIELNTDLFQCQSALSSVHPAGLEPAQLAEAIQMWICRSSYKRHRNPAANENLLEFEELMMPQNLNEDNLSGYRSSNRQRGGVWRSETTQMMKKSHQESSLNADWTEATITAPTTTTLLVLDPREANAIAISLKPWMRGLSWNRRRLSWIVRRWGPDGKTLIAASIPARRYGGVVEAYQRACEIRSVKFGCFVLGRVAREAGPRHPFLRWDFVHSAWQLELPKQGLARTLFRASTEEGVRAARIHALKILAATGDVDASRLLMLANNKLGTRPPGVTRAERGRRSEGVTVPSFDSSYPSKKRRTAADQFGQPVVMQQSREQNMPSFKNQKYHDGAGGPADSVWDDRLAGSVEVTASKSLAGAAVDAKNAILAGGNESPIFSRQSEPIASCGLERSQPFGRRGNTGAEEDDVFDEGYEEDEYGENVDNDCGAESDLDGADNVVEEHSDEEEAVERSTRGRHPRTSARVSARSQASWLEILTTNDVKGDEEETGDSQASSDSSSVRGRSRVALRRRRPVRRSMGRASASLARQSKRRRRRRRPSSTLLPPGRPTNGGSKAGSASYFASAEPAFGEHATLKSFAASNTTTTTTTTAAAAAAASLGQQVPPGLIWAGSSNRFFAVFRDPNGSQKPRFKTFDANMYGGVSAAYNEATAFLSTVEPWERLSWEQRRSLDAKKSGGEYDTTSSEEATHLTFCRFGDVGDAVNTNDEEELRGLLTSSPPQIHGSKSKLFPDTGGVSQTGNARRGSFRGPLDSGAYFDWHNALPLQNGENAPATSDAESQQQLLLTQLGSAHDTARSLLDRFSASNSSFPTPHYSTDVNKQIIEMETDLMTLPHCDRIKWYRSKRGFSASIYGRSKWFSAFSRGVEAAWTLAYEWLKTQKAAQGDTSTIELRFQIPTKLSTQISPTLGDKLTGVSEPALEGGAAPGVIVPSHLSTAATTAESLNEAGTAEYGPPLHGNLAPHSVSGGTAPLHTAEGTLLYTRQSTLPQNSAAAGFHHNLDPAGSPKLPSSGTNPTPSIDTPTTWRSSLSSSKLAFPPQQKVSWEELASQIQMGCFESDDSVNDMNEQARRLPKLSSMCWVPQKQAFSVFYCRDPTTMSKTTKAFNPHHYGGVKRSFKQAALFFLELQENRRRSIPAASKANNNNPTATPTAAVSAEFGTAHSLVTHE